MAAKIRRRKGESAPLSWLGSPNTCKISSQPFLLIALFLCNDICYLSNKSILAAHSSFREISTGVVTMRCPKCGYISFDQVTSCGKCGKDVAELAAQLQGTAVNVIPPLFLGFEVVEEESAPEEQLETAAEEESDIDFSMTDATLSAESSESTDIDMAEDADLDLDLAADDAEPALSMEADTETDVDLALGEAQADLSLDEEDADISLAEEEPSPDLDLSLQEETPVSAAADEADITLEEDSEPAAEPAVAKKAEKSGSPMGNLEEDAFGLDFVLDEISDSGDEDFADDEDIDLSDFDLSLEDDDK